MQSRRLLRPEAGPPAQAALRELAGPLDAHLRAALELLWAAIFVRKTGAGPARAAPPKGEALPAVPRTDAERRAKAEAERRAREHGAWEVSPPLPTVAPTHVPTVHSLCHSLLCY